MPIINEPYENNLNVCFPPYVWYKNPPTKPPIDVPGKWNLKKIAIIIFTYFNIQIFKNRMKFIIQFSSVGKKCMNKLVNQQVIFNEQ